MRTIKFFLCVVSACVLVVSAQAQNVLSKKMYKSYRGLVMAGYQGWHNAMGDGANRGWYHYRLILQPSSLMTGRWLVSIPTTTIPRWILISAGCRNMDWMVYSCSDSSPRYAIRVV